MSKKLSRSKKYDFFKPGDSKNSNNEKKNGKEKFKIGFKWFKVVFFVFLAALSLTGCIQTYAIQSSSLAGSGIEFYQNEDEISPFVSTFKIKTTTNDDGEEIKYLEFLPKDNYLLSNDNDQITKIKNEWKEEGYGDLYGKYGNHSSALRIIDEDNNLVSYDTTKSIDSDLILGTKTKTPIVLNDFYLNELNEEIDNYYNFKNNISSIPLFLIKKPNTKPSDTSSDSDGIPSNYNQGQPAVGSYAFQAVQQVGETSDDWRVVSINSDGKYVDINTNNPLDPEVESDKAIIDKFKYVFQYDYAELESYDNAMSLFPAEAYARDYLQSLANVLINFDQFKTFDYPTPTSPTAPEQRLNNLSNHFNDEKRENVRFVETSKSNPNPLVTSSDIPFLLSSEEKKAIEKYQIQIYPLLQQTKFNIKKLNFDGEEPNDWNTPYSFEFNQGINQNSTLIAGSPVPQKPITNWGEAWGLGPFYGFVVYPLSFMVNGLAHGIPSMAGWGSVLSIAIAVIIVRLFTFLISYKSSFAQSKQAMLAPKKAKIDAKYAPYKGNKMMEQRKRQEISELYKKNNINMVTPLLSALVSMPIFLAMWRVIQGIPIIKSTDWLGINFASTSYQELFAGAWQYLPLIIMAALIQAGSQIVPRLLSKKRMKERANVAEKQALKKSNRTQNIVMGVFIFMALIFEAGIQIYWIVGGIWMMGQACFIHWIQKTKFFKEKLIKYV